ncbi:MAG: insulinase family protein, partial [Variibacter sp.]|nr:insulinase family protein [Variibacter sp.]
FLNHPYHRPIIGWRNEMETLDRNDAIAFYRRFYTPNNAILILAGDVTPERARELAAATYAKVAKQMEVGPRKRPQEPVQLAPRTVTLSDARVAQPSLQRSYLVPSETTAAKGEAEALDVLTHVLGTGSVSRLYRALVIDKRLAASAGGWYQRTALDHTRLALYATPRAGVALPDLEAAMDAVIAEIIEKGVTSEELERAKSRMIADMIYAQDSQASLARIYGAALTTGGTIEDVLTWPDRIRAVTGEQVLAAARKWLDKRRSVTGYLVRDPAAPAPAEGKRS